MFQLLGGLALFASVHLWRRLAPSGRGRWGDRGKLVVTVASIGGVWLMARGYGAWDDAPVAWTSAGWLRGLNNLLVVVAFYLFVSSGMQAWGARATRHPQLVAVILWATAHLLVNGDAASIVLFGGLLLWAAAEVLLINRAEPLWSPPPRQPLAKEATAVAATVVAVGVAGWVHGWIGPWPFGT